MDFEPFFKDDCRSLGRCTEHEALIRGARIWNIDGNVDCMDHYNNVEDIWKCALGPYAYPFMKNHNKIFVMQYNFDSAQMGHDGIYEIPTKPKHEAYARE